ncbi:MAG: hypothetical protein H0X45_09680 [Planctomycetes bacterium]|nr:hypothetical protein [Planctomycetota bacterium]
MSHPCAPPNASALAFDWLGERCCLSQQRALHWPRTATLIVADVHLGKAAAFRTAGRPVPEACTQADPVRLDALIVQTQARRLIIRHSVRSSAAT